MNLFRLKLFAVVVLFVASIEVWIVRRAGLPPADFTFNNQTELQALDPALTTGVPEHRILDALFEGLTRPNPDTYEPEPGVAESWEISEDGLVYTFKLRSDAKWSNGDRVTAEDFVYSLQRFLDPLTAARYAYQGWYLVGAKKYSSGSSALEVGDRVNVELMLASGLPVTARGELRPGILRAVREADALPEGFAADNWGDKVYEIELEDGKLATYRVCFEPTEAARWEGSPQVCRQVVLHFEEVGVRAIDSDTLEMTLEGPTPFWLELLAHPSLFPVNRKCVETHGSPAWTKAENMVGNGAFRLEMRRIRDRIRLRKSETYWDRENVKLEVIDALAIEKGTTAFNLYETGKVDWIPQTEPLTSRELFRLGRDKVDLNPSPQFTVYFYGLNTSVPPLDDARVRRALSLAMNRKEITTVATGAGEIPARSLVPPGLRGYEQQMFPAEDVEEAKRLLAEAGFPEGRGFPRLEILYNVLEAHRTIAELIRKQWQRNLGITVVTRSEEWGTYLSSQRQQKFQIVRRAWVGDYMDANTFLDMFVTGGENNNTSWSHEEYDQIIVAASQETDLEQRINMLEQAEAILMEELPVLPIYYYVSRNLVKPYVFGIYNNLQDQHPLRAIYIDRSANRPNNYIRDGRE